MASLGHDLALIRKDQNLSLDEINKATKIPKRILRSIEDDSIFSDFDENATYIRSYVRSYAKALSVDEKQIIYALDKRQKSSYSGSLRKSWKEDPHWADDQLAEEESSEKGPGESESDIRHDHSPEYQQGSEPESQKHQTRPVSSSTASERSEVQAIDWADMGRQFQPLQSTRPKTWIGIIVILIVAAAGIYSYFWYTGQTPTPPEQSSSQTSSPQLTSDSLQLDVSPVTNDSPSVASDTGSVGFQQQSFESLPDTLSIVLYAAYGKLEPVRVYTDIMDNINPYWIEQGDALRFTFVNEIRIRGQYSRMALLMNGHVIQNFREQFYNPDTRLVEINRSYFEGTPKWLQPAPDSLNIDAPPPSSIKRRPTFN